MDRQRLQAQRALDPGLQPAVPRPELYRQHLDTRVPGELDLLFGQTQGIITIHPRGRGNGCYDWTEVVKWTEGFHSESHIGTFFSLFHLLWRCCGCLYGMVQFLVAFFIFILCIRVVPRLYAGWCSLWNARRKSVKTARAV